MATPEISNARPIGDGVAPAEKTIMLPRVTTAPYGLRSLSSGVAPKDLILDPVPVETAAWGSGIVTKPKPPSGVANAGNR
jgi:hypothetical protein